jgi:hypothetical protein
MTLRDRFYRAETAEEIAEICRLEAEQNGGPFWCPTCGVELSADDTIPCQFDYAGYKCGVELRR